MISIDNSKKYLKITWNDASLFSPSKKYINVSIMETVGYLEIENNEFIIVSNPITVNKTSQKKHPDTNPTFYLIPKGMIVNIETL